MAMGPGTVTRQGTAPPPGNSVLDAKSNQRSSLDLVKTAKLFGDGVQLGTLGSAGALDFDFVAVAGSSFWLDGSPLRYATTSPPGEHATCKSTATSARRITAPDAAGVSN